MGSIEDSEDVISEGWGSMRKKKLRFRER